MEKYRLIKISGLKGRRYLTESGRILRRLRSGEFREIRKVQRNKGKGPLSVNLILKSRAYHWFKAADLVAFTYFCKRRNYQITVNHLKELKKYVRSFHVNSNLRDFNYRNIQLKWIKPELSLYDILDDTEYKWWFEKLGKLDNESWTTFNERAMKQLLRNIPVLIDERERKIFFAKLFDVAEIHLYRIIPKTPQAD